MKLNIPSLDLKLSSEGTWCQYQEGIEFKIARFGNKPYTDAVNAMYKRNKRAIESNSMEEELAEKLNVETMAQFILTDWKGLKNGKDNFPYSIENSKKLLLDPSYIELRQWIMEQSKEVELYRNTEQKK